MLEYIAFVDHPNLFRLHKYSEFHNHYLTKKASPHLKDWWQKKGRERNTIAENKWKKNIGTAKRDWQKEFKQSLTYELSAVYSSQLVQKEAVPAIEQAPAKSVTRAEDTTSHYSKYKQTPQKFSNLRI
jgi:cytolysin (calcineurin-like family phosphatase)